MAGNMSDASRLVQGLFTLGTTGQMTDGQLLDRFLARRDEGAEAAFEELMTRHGPMVLRVCRGVLRDPHDAEDAFQAAFLVLAHQAGSIRRRNSLASWLFGVAQRVAAHAKLRAARVHAGERMAATRRGESYESADDQEQLETLQDEIARLPDHLRAPIALCYLEGLDYQEAGIRLGLSEGAVRGRLARARERLRRGLVRRGEAVSATLMLAGEGSQAQPAVPVALFRSTMGVASGFITGNMAATLARGVIRSMFLRRLKIAMALLTLGIGTSYLALHLLAAGQDNKGQRITAPKAVPNQKQPERQEAGKAKAIYRLTGSVRVEGTGQPIEGARLEVQVDTSTPSEGGPAMKEVKSGADGTFGIDVLQGNARIWLLNPPPGYWLANTDQWGDDMAFGPEAPEQRKDFLLRPGTPWVFRYATSPKRGAHWGMVWSGYFRALTDDQGLAHLTLPSEGGRYNVFVFLKETTRIPISLPMTLDSPPQFRPDKMKEIAPVKGGDRAFRLIDLEGRSATILAPVPIEPIIEGGRLTIQVALPIPSSSEEGELVGQVVDHLGRPIAGAHLALTVSSGPIAQEWGDKGPQWTTDEQGRYHLRGVPRQTLTGRLTRLYVFVTKEGFAGAGSPEIHFDSAEKGKPLEVGPIQLQPGMELRGVVVDHQGHPVVGAWVRSSRLPGQSTRTDEHGHFTSRNLYPGPISLAVSYGRLKDEHTYLADGSPEEVRIQLPAQPEAVEAPNAPRAPLPQPLAIGQPAPEWLPGVWSDGRLRTLAEQRNRVVVLYFWNISDVYSVSRLPVLAQIRNEFEPRGVFFLAIHGPGEDEKQVRKVLEFKKTPLLWAMDLERQASSLKRIGATAWQYGLQSIPLVVGIDKNGKVAFRGDPQGWSPAPAGKDEKHKANRTEESLNQSFQKELARQIERIVDRKD